MFHSLLITSSRGASGQAPHFFARRPSQGKLENGGDGRSGRLIAPQKTTGREGAPARLSVLGKAAFSLVECFLRRAAVGALPERNSGGGESHLPVKAERGGGCLSRSVSISWRDCGASPGAGKSGPGERKEQPGGRGLRPGCLFLHYFTPGRRTPVCRPPPAGR